MFVMTARVIFPARLGKDGQMLNIKRISEVTIESSWKEMFGRAEIILPRNVKFFDKHKVRELFRKDDPVIIELGYDGKNYQEFTGYISEVSSDIPIKIKCLDEMVKLSRIAVNYSASSTTLADLLNAICPGYDIDALEGVSLGGVRFAKTTVGAVLKKLQSDWKLYSYIRGKQLVCGKYYSPNSSLKPVRFNLERNVVDNALNYKNKEDIILKIKASSILKNGSKLEYTLGNEGGDILDLTYYNIEVRAELERKVKADYERALLGGFDGTITAFGWPRINQGEKAELISKLYPDRNGIYYADGVKKTWGQNGYRQEIKIGNKASG